jgi:GntR family transcriptional regulator
VGLTINRIDRNTPVPLYYQLKLIILNMVNNGQLKAGDAIPSEKELGKKYNLSRITVRSAIQELVQEGYLVKKRGVGTFVAGPKIRRGIDRLNSFSADMISSGHKPGTILMEFGVEKAIGTVAASLKIPEGQKVWFVERLRTVDGEPIGHSLSYLNLPEGIDLKEEELSKELSLWSLLEEKDLNIKEVEDTVQAIVANSRQAKLLHVQYGAPLLLIEGVAYGADDMPIEYSRVVNRADRFKYSIRVTSNHISR